MSELWKARAAAGRALEITPTRALQSTQLCGHFAARQPHHARPGLNGSLLGYPRPRCKGAGSLWRACAALRGRKAKISRQDATGFGVFRADKKQNSLEADSAKSKIHLRWAA